METQAIARFVRISPRKMDLLVRSIKDMQPRQAVVMLEFMRKSGAEPLHKVISSALASARNHNMAMENIQFKAIEVGKGSSMKRFRPVSRGMAHEYRKRMSHIKVVLTDEKSTQQSVKQEKELKSLK